MRGIAETLPAFDLARKMLTLAAERHLAYALEHIASGDYLGEHWLATFAVRLLADSRARA